MPVLRGTHAPARGCTHHTGRASPATKWMHSTNPSQCYGYPPLSQTAVKVERQHVAASDATHANCTTVLYTRVQPHTVVSLLWKAHMNGCDWSGGLHGGVALACMPWPQMSKGGGVWLSGRMSQMLAAPDAMHTNTRERKCHHTESTQSLPVYAVVPRLPDSCTLQCVCGTALMLVTVLY
jgi:hypothetical protein